MESYQRNLVASDLPLVHIFTGILRDGPLVQTSIHIIFAFTPLMFAPLSASNFDIRAHRPLCQTSLPVQSTYNGEQEATAKA